MKILIINAGSSTLKYQLIDMQNEQVIAKGNAEQVTQNGGFIKHEANGNEVKIERPFPTHLEAANMVLELLTSKEYGVLKSLDEISAVGHRFVHGAHIYTDSVVATDDVINQLEKLSDLAPLHTPGNLAGLNACKKALPSVPNVLIFDTAFHSTMPEHVYRYAIPTKAYEEFKIRKYGMHGTSYKYIAGEMAKILNKPLESLNLIICHIGSGASISAVKNGKAYDTTMGFTPLEGLMMGTRSGDLDPGMLEYLSSKTGKNISEINRYLNKESGVLGVFEKHSDMRYVEEEMNSNPKAKLAMEMFCYRIKKYIGSYIAALNGVDAIIFTAGVGENSTVVREKVLEDLSFLGIKLDREKNNSIWRKGTSKQGKISAEDSKVLLYVLPTNEELEIARQTLNKVK